MRLRELRLTGYRNFDRLELKDTSNGVNLVVGGNAQGKTNLIEAVNYASCARSFRSVPEDRLITEGKREASIYTAYTCENVPGKIEMKLRRGERKSIKVGGLPITRLSQLLGEFNTVVFAPEDMRTVKESPGLRRRLIDVELSKIRPAYYSALCDYHIALKSKNKLLKEFRCDDELIFAYNEALCAAGEKMIAARAEYIKGLNEFAAEIHAKLSGCGEALELRYKCSAELDNIKGSLEKKMKAALPREKELRTAIAGPHREDCEIIIEEHDARLNASQGQQRTAMISIKLAVAHMAAKSTGARPVLLLDDVFSELDAKRREALLSSVGDFQVFITSTDMLPLPSGAAVFGVRKGELYDI